jgi:hypothetical protein
MSYTISYTISYTMLCGFAVPFFGGVASPDPGRPDVRCEPVQQLPALRLCFSKDTILQSCQDPCKDICRQGIELCRT